ncbi:MAG TPA: TonB-dependent receptor [Opitutaceae bacterium]|nr:TonB-dependent receptor [Opitutaceae bacterium]
MQHPTTPAHHRLRLLRAVAVGGLIIQSALLAQTAVDPNAASSSTSSSDDVVKLEEYRVTSGFATSLQLAAAAKQASPNITEVLMSEDIGKLPDISIADSLTRLTGLTTQRVNGRSQDIIIRGFTGDFSTGLLNGREQASTGENRAVEFDQYPAELLDSVVVYKTAQANLTDQGLAGTIDMHTVQPLSKGHRIIAANGYYDWTQYNQLTPGAKSKGNRFNLTYVDQFADNTVGVALGYSHTATPFEGKQFQAWGYPTDSAGNFALGGTKSYVRTSNLNRDSAMGILEYRPNENIHSTIDVFVSRFEEKQLLRGMEIPLAFWSSAVLQSGYTTSGGLITNATLTNVQPVVRNDVFKRNDSPFSIGWNLKLGEKSEWPVVLDLGYSRVTRTDINLETYSGLGFRAGAANPDTMKVQLIPGQIPIITSTLDYSSGSILKLTDPQGWGSTSLPGGGMQGYLKYFQAKDELGEVRLSTSHKFDKIFKDVQFGVTYTDRYKRDGEGPSGFIDSVNNSNTNPLPPQIGTTDMSFLGLGRIYAYDPLAAYSAGTWGFTPNLDGGIVANRFQIEEKVAQFYGQLNFMDHVGDFPLSGNIGIRAISTDQESKGYSANGNVLNPVSDSFKYTNLAPDLNLNYKLEANTVLRFSVARQLASPRMYDMRDSRTWGFDPSLSGSTDLSRSPWSGSGGNFRLKPWKANSVDLSIEHYFAADKGYVSLAGFNKQLLTYIYTQNSVANFSGYPTQGTTPALNQGIISTPVNGQGGSIRGFELTLQLPSELISKSIPGFGLVLNGAYTDSKIKPWGPTGGDSPIAGFSRKVGNITLFYERFGWSFRISERYRSEAREYITTFGPPNRGGDVSPGSGFTMAQPEKVVDAQVSYAFQSGPLKNLTFYLQGYNLNNEPLVTYNNGDPRQVMNYQKYGASYSFGASYKF